MTMEKRFDRFPHPWAPDPAAPWIVRAANGEEIAVCVARDDDASPIGSCTHHALMMSAAANAIAEIAMAVRVKLAEYPSIIPVVSPFKAE
jgi:hypothetical protein